MSDQVQVFICYAKEDIEIAKRLYDDLKNDNDLNKARVTPWMDVADIQSGQYWEFEIRKAIKRSSYFLALLSSNSVLKSGYVQKELRMAIEILDKMPPYKIFILPIRLDDCNPLYEKLEDIHWTDIFPPQNYVVGFNKIRRVLLGTKPNSSDSILNVSRIILNKKATLAYYGFEKPDEFTNSLDMKFIYIQPGKFMMGSPENEPGSHRNEILHQVTLTKGFYMQNTQVTQKQWKALKVNNPSKFKDCEDAPVEQVSWNDVQDFIKRLNNKEGGNRYRLPTEAEWEYACRAGSNTLYCFGNDKNKLREYAWYDRNSDNETHLVSQLDPNEWGLYDMHGNVWEWCSDWFGDYTTSPVIGPEGPKIGSHRVLRGGSYHHNEYYCRSANRDKDYPQSRHSNYGFRLVRLL